MRQSIEGAVLTEEEIKEAIRGELLITTDQLIALLGDRGEVAGR